MNGRFNIPQHKHITWSVSVLFCVVPLLSRAMRAEKLCVCIYNWQGVVVSIPAPLPVSMGVWGWLVAGIFRRQYKMYFPYLTELIL